VLSMVVELVEHRRCVFNEMEQQSEL